MLWAARRIVPDGLQVWGDVIVFGRVCPLFRMILSFRNQRFIHVAVRLLCDRPIGRDAHVAVIRFKSAAIRALDGISGFFDSLGGSTRVRRVLMSGRVLRSGRVVGKDWHDRLLWRWRVGVMSHWAFLGESSPGAHGLAA